MLFEAGIEILLFLRPLSSFQALLEGFGLKEGGVIIHDTYVVNTVLTLHPEVSDEETPLHLFYVLRRIPFELVLPSTHGATCVDFGVVTYMSGGEDIYR